MKCPTEIGDPSGLLALSAGKAERPEAVRLREHLETCSACREFVAAQDAVWRALDVWEPPAITADFDQQLYRRIEQQVNWWERALSAIRPVLVRQGLPIAAAACLVIVAGLVSRQPADVASPAKTPAAQVENLQPEQVEHVLNDMQMLSDFTRAARSDGGEL